MSVTEKVYIYLGKHPDSFSTLKELNLAGVCAAGRTIHLDSSGNVYPCSPFLGHKEFIAGNLIKQTSG